MNTPEQKHSVSSKTSSHAKLEASRENVEAKTFALAMQDAAWGRAWQAAANPFEAVVMRLKGRKARQPVTMAWLQAKAEHRVLLDARRRA